MEKLVNRASSAGYYQSLTDPGKEKTQLRPTLAFLWEKGNTQLLTTLVILSHLKREGGNKQTKLETDVKFTDQRYRLTKN